MKLLSTRQVIPGSDREVHKDPARFFAGGEEEQEQQEAPASSSSHPCHPRAPRLNIQPSGRYYTNIGVTPIPSPGGATLAYGAPVHPDDPIRPAHPD